MVPGYILNYFKRCLKRDKRVQLFNLTRTLRKDTEENCCTHEGRISTHEEFSSFAVRQRAWVNRYILSLGHFLSLSLCMIPATPVAKEGWLGDVISLNQLHLCYLLGIAMILKLYE